MVDSCRPSHKCAVKDGTSTQVTKYTFSLNHVSTILSAMCKVKYLAMPNAAILHIVLTAMLLL